MRHEILPNGNLKITVTPEERSNIRSLQSEPDFESDETMHDIMELLVCNSGLEWSTPEAIGALTSAPVLAIAGKERLLAKGETAGRGNRLSAFDCGKVLVCPIEQAWAFMAYQITSPQRELAENGECVWQCGK